MNYNTEGWQFDEVRDQILLATAEAEHGFYESTLGDLATGYDGSGILTADGPYVLTESGLKNLCERIDYPQNALMKLPPELRQGVVRHMAAEKTDVPVKLATAEDQIESIFSAEYEPINNGKLAIILGHLLPEDATVHRWNLTRANRTLDLRVVCRDSWAVDLGNGQPDPGFGGLHITNDELGRGALKVSLAVARVGCMNFMISSQEVLRQEHRWFSPEELMAHMTEAVTHVHEYALQEATEMRAWRGIPVPEPGLVFTQVAERAGIPQYAMDSAAEYWQEDGENHNQFAVLQAVSHGLKQVTERARGNPWKERNRIEELLLRVGAESNAHYQETGHTTWQECTACHRPLEE
jgi:hypothetical protein